jgi:hypothetical protein
METRFYAAATAGIAMALVLWWRRHHRRRDSSAQPALELPKSTTETVPMVSTPSGSNPTADIHLGEWSELQGGDPRDDEQREARNASATRFVTEKMLGENTNLVQILASRTFSERVCSNLSARLFSKEGELPTIKLVYKGGSVMRHVLTKLAHDLPQLQTVINEEYGGSFGMSDHDFKLVIEPTTFARIITCKGSAQIDVGMNSFNQAASLELIAAMKGKSMVSIDMKNCQLGAEGAKAVAELVLVTPSSLTSVR